MISSSPAATSSSSLLASDHSQFAPLIHQHIIGDQRLARPPPVWILPAVILYSRKTFEPSAAPQPLAFSFGSISSALGSASFMIFGYPVPLFLPNCIYSCNRYSFNAGRQSSQFFPCTLCRRQVNDILVNFVTGNSAAQPV